MTVHSAFKTYKTIGLKLSTCTPTARRSRSSRQSERSSHHGGGGSKSGRRGGNASASADRPSNGECQPPKELQFYQNFMTKAMEQQAREEAIRLANEPPKITASVSRAPNDIRTLSWAPAPNQVVHTVGRRCKL